MLYDMKKRKIYFINFWASGLLTESLQGTSRVLAGLKLSCLCSSHLSCVRSSSKPPRSPRLLQLFISPLFHLPHPPSLPLLVFTIPSILSSIVCILLFSPFFVPLLLLRRFYVVSHFLFFIISFPPFLSNFPFSSFILLTPFSRFLSSLIFLYHIFPHFSFSFPFPLSSWAATCFCYLHNYLLSLSYHPTRSFSWCASFTSCRLALIFTLFLLHLFLLLLFLIRSSLLFLGHFYHHLVLLFLLFFVPYSFFLPSCCSFPFFICSTLVYILFIITLFLFLPSRCPPPPSFSSCTSYLPF